MNNIELLTPTKIVKSKRKTLSLQINLNGELIVRAPLSYTEKRINEFINKKSDWIIAKRSEYILNQKYFPVDFNEHNTINILGETYKIELINNARTKIGGGIIFVPKDNAKENLVRFLKRLTRKIVTEKVTKFSNDYNFEYQNISISSAKTNWGSCSYSNKLHFSYKLIMCPESVVNYIVIHELCHTKVKNHSKDFYKLIASIMPDYKLCEKWLKQNKAIINVI